MSSPLIDSPLAQVIVGALGALAAIIGAWLHARKQTPRPPASVEAGPGLMGAADQISGAVQKLGWRVESLERTSEKIEAQGRELAVVGDRLERLEEIAEQVRLVKHMVAQTAQIDQVLNAKGITREDIEQAQRLRAMREAGE